MRSSTGAHYIALDHVRALAALLVFSWHFTHGPAGFPVPFAGVPAVAPLALFDEGHTGVALFMTLSGYLFAKLLDGRAVHYPTFVLNRALRLLPLLVVVMAMVGVMRWRNGQPLGDYAWSLVQGFVYPAWPNGGWSIAVELHFYLLLPLLLGVASRRPTALLAVLAGALALRWGLHQSSGEVQTSSYWTLVGRIDQFVSGILFFHLRRHVAGRHLVVLMALAAFVGLYVVFDARGGFYGMPSYPSPSRWWIVLPTLEGLAYGLGIAWYDSSFQHGRGRLSSFIATLGEYSYSIYLLHVFVVFDGARWVHEHLLDLSRFETAWLGSIVAFALMVIPGYLSYRFIEAPFLRLRRPYLRAPS